MTAGRSCGGSFHEYTAGYCYLTIKRTVFNIKNHKFVTFRGVPIMSVYEDVSELCRKAPRSSDCNDKSVIILYRGQWPFIKALL